MRVYTSRVSWYDNDMPTTTITRPYARATDAPLVLTPALLAFWFDYGDDLLDFIADNATTTCVECDNDLDGWAQRGDDDLCDVCRVEAIRDAYAHDAYDRAGDR